MVGVRAVFASENRERPLCIYLSLSLSLSLPPSFLSPSRSRNKDKPKLKIAKYKSCTPQNKLEETHTKENNKKKKRRKKSEMIISHLNRYRPDQNQVPGQKKRRK